MTEKALVPQKLEGKEGFIFLGYVDSAHHTITPLKTDTILKSMEYYLVVERSNCHGTVLCWIDNPMSIRHTILYCVKFKEHGKFNEIILNAKL